MPGFSVNDTLLAAQRAANEGNWTDALAQYVALIDAPEAKVSALFGAGVCCLELGDPEAAVGYLSRAWEADPSNETITPVLAEAWRRRGGQHRTRENLDEAHNCLQKAYQLSPNDPAILNDMAVVLRSQGDLAGAETLYRHAIEAKPGQALLHANLGNVLEAAGRIRLAEIELHKAYELDPDAGDIASNLAALLTKRHRPQEALPLLERKAKVSPDRWDVLTNLGVARLNTGDVTGAEDALRQSLRLEPNNAEAHYNLAWVLLLTGRFEEGWRSYEWRWQMEHFSSEQRDFCEPLWDGKPLTGPLLLHAEQGLGDAIQFMRFAKLCMPHCSQVILEVPRPLVRLAELLDPDIQIIPQGQMLPPFDAQAPLMSLPHLLGTTVQSVPASSGYLTLNDQAEARLQLPQTKRLRVGFVWAGSKANKMDGIRSMAAQTLMPLARRPDIYPVNLQIGGKDSEWSDLLGSCDGFDASDVVDDFLDTAAIVQQLDMVIGVDTAVVHLAGALGKACAVMVPFMPDYRWMLDRTDTPWYDCVFVARQSEPGHWGSVIDQLAARLDDLPHPG